jgi:retinol dehydrogenase-12
MVSINSMVGKVILITGGTSGIGEVTARSLARMGATTVLVGRNPERTNATVQSIRAATLNVKVDAFIADLSSQAQVRSLAEDFKKRYDRLDVLINNAGAVFFKREVSADGMEMTLALNHISYFLLTNLLLDVLKASKPARIVNVSSESHRGARLNFSDLEYQHGYAAMKAYGQSKLANISFTYGLAAMQDDSGLTVNALHPGFVATNFGRSNGGIFKSIFKVVHLAAITPEEGALTSIYLASSPEVEGVTGKYFIKSQSVPSSHVSYDMDAARHLWDWSLEKTGLPMQTYSS